MSALGSCERLAVAVVCALSLAGCADSLSPTGGSGDSGSYYPLAVGNEWVYAGHSSYTVDSAGFRSTRVVPTVLEVEMLPDSVLSMGQCYAREGGRSGTAEFMTQPYQVNLIRQDSKGLYQLIPLGYLGADFRRGASTTDGPGNDGTRLPYPLRVGATWVNQYGLDARVEAVEFVSVPAGHFAAWRVALAFSGTVLERDWYSDVGLVKYRFHSESDVAVRDSAGVAVGMKRVTADFAYDLKSFTIVGPPGRLLRGVLPRR